MSTQLPTSTQQDDVASPVTVERLDRVWCDAYYRTLHIHWQPDRGDDYQAALDAARHAAIVAVLTELAGAAERVHEGMLGPWPEGTGHLVADWHREIAT
jgi:hypothetical protein